MGFYAILINSLVFCGIIFLIALIVATIMVIMILLDIRRTTKEVREKVTAIASILDIVGLLFGGMGTIKKKLGSNLGTNSAAITGFAAGLKKALQVLFKK